MAFSSLVNPLLKKRSGLARSMTGSSPAFGQPAPFSPPDTYGFNALAGAEEARRLSFGQNAQDQIMDTRNRLSTSLTDYGKKFFQQQNPTILEDLNARGLLTSPTEVAGAQANALKDIELSNQNYLREFDTAALSAGLQAQQDALDSGLDLRRASLEAGLNEQMAAREEAMARDLAKQQGRNSLYSSLIGAGGSLFGGMLAGGGGLFGGGAGAAGATGGSGAAGAGGAGAAFLPVAGAAAGLGLYEGIRKSLVKKGVSKDLAKVGGALPMAALPIAVASKPIKKVAKSIKKAFCFDGHTPIRMEDGSEKAIKDIGLGQKTAGGIVLSVQASICADGDLYDYQGCTVTASHAVKENGSWIRVEDSPYAKAIDGQMIVYGLVTTDHRIYVEGITFADTMETDDYEWLDLDQSLDALNKEDGLVGVN